MLPDVLRARRAPRKEAEPCHFIPLNSEQETVASLGPDPDVVRGPLIAWLRRTIDDLETVTRLHDGYPQYGFDRHVGYATAAHREAIVEHGVCDLHRLSFASVAYRQLDLGPRN